MFTINLSFYDALTCFEALSRTKEKDDLVSVEREFFRYAEKKADIGDVAAKVWLDANQDKSSKFNLSSKQEAQKSPMSYFVGKTRPPEKDEELKKLEEGGNKSYPDSILSMKKKNKPKNFGEDLNRAERYAKEVERVLETLVKVELSPEDIDRAMERLDRLVGLEGVKKQLRRILETKLVDSRREAAGLKTFGKNSHHMVFTGAPGTGKTSVARQVGAMFKDLKILSKGHLVEVGRSDLVGEYIGQTEQIIKDIFKKALGGVLFIDEAYSLFKPQSANDFGHDVIAALVKYMEDERGNVVVIFAGYADMMSVFLRSNPGLHSRIAHHVHFENMNTEQLASVFENLCAEYDYKMDAGAQEKLLHVIKDLKRTHESEFPNARGVRNLFEDTITRQSARLLQDNVTAKGELQQIIADDIAGGKPHKSGNVVHLPRQ
jgi:SpoVK/Ycf46/Vps4 family AAA+-type ATPase